jgi:hypothetical protein
MNEHPATEESLEAVFSVVCNTSLRQQIQTQQRRTAGGRVFYVVHAKGYQWGKLSSVVRQWPASNGVEGEESPLLEAVTRKRLVESVTD